MNPISLNAWHHFALVRNASLIETVFIDGIKATGAAGGTSVSGGQQVNNLDFNGATQDICKYYGGAWTGYITNLNKDNKNCYISFFHKNKKIALHRLLYCNFVEELNDNEYLKFTCENKGKCCSLKHLKKFVIEKAPIIQEKKEEIVKVIGHNNKVFF
jgi:hypothetical protein